MSSNKRTSKVKNGILIAVVIAFLISIVAGTYARYTSSGRVDSAGEIAKWHVTLGGQDISSETKTIDVSLTADEESNENTTSGKLAPGQVLSGTFKVDPTGTEVAVDYLLSIGSVQATGGTWNTGSELSLLKVTALVEGEENATELTVANSNAIYFEDLASVTNGKDVTFKIYVTWKNANDANNVADTANGSAITQITIPVTVVVRQHIGDVTPQASTSYTVTFKDGETTLSTQTVNEGETATKPTDPTKDGFEFVNWYSDSEFTTEYDFASIINGDTTIYAKWTETATVSTNPSATPNIAANAAKNIGDYGKVINYTPTNPSGVESPGTVSEWRLFYADESNAYLIGSSLDNTTKALHTLPNFSSMTAVSDLGKSLNPKYTTWTLQTTSGKWSFNLNAVAALTDTSSTSPWKAYESSDTNWAIGGVPLELWIASFNASHSLTTSTGYDCRVEEGGTAKGYQVKYSSSGSYGKSTSSNMVNYLVESPNLQAIYYNGGVTYWLASPSDNTYHTVMVTFFNGYLGNSYLSDPSSVRPLVSIPKSKISSQLTAE